MAEKTINSEFHKTQDQQPALGIGEKWLELRYDPVTGDTRLYEYNIIGGVVGKKEKVYENGVWNYNPGAVTSVSEKVKVHSLVKDTINKLKGDSRNIIPAFVSQDAPSQDIGSSGTPVPSENSSGLSGLVGQVLGGTLDIDSIQFGTNMSTVFPTPLKYPIDLIEKHQDTLRITQYEYKAPYGDIFEGKQKEDIFKLGAQRQSALKKKIQTLTLPIPNNVADSNAVNWGNGDATNTFSMGAAGNMGAVVAGNLLSDAGELLGGLKSPGLGKALGDEKTKNAITSLLIGGLSNPTTAAAIESLLLKRAGFDISAETILSRGYGVVANSNLELLFSGPILRSFQFGYIFSPRSENEAAMCRKIIRFFKQGMAAKKSNKLSGYGAASFLLGTPNVFKLEYKTSGNKDIAGLNKFKICALSNIQTSYADGQWSAYDEGQPVRTQIMLSFKELEPVYESDYQEKGSDKFISPLGDQPSVGPDEIGF